MNTGTLKIHSENILPIIKRWLYTEKEIFVRELVSNACDAISKLKKIQNDTTSNWRIDVTIDKDKRQIIFSDNGIGMDHEEVEKYIAQIAFSGAEEFVKKYQTSKEEDPIIGHFGLGFYSAYMVAEIVEIQTLSYKTNAQPVYWKCDGGSSYTIDTGIRKERGTQIILTLNKDEDEYLDATFLRGILTRYCSFLPYPIHLNNSCINEKPPLWMKAATDCTEQEYLDFYRQLFPGEADPLFWIHLNVDYPFQLKGILYFPRVSRENELKKETIKFFCNRVFVSDNCRDFLPDYLTILRGAIDSPDIPLNVSRSTLQVDRTVKQLGTHISKKISDRLSSLYVSEREKFLSFWEDVELVLKLGILQDEKFYEKVKEFLIWKNAHGEWTTVEEYLERHPGSPVYYAPSEGHFLDLYKEKGIEVLISHASMLDQAIMQFIERKTQAKFKRIDASLDDKLLDPTKERSLLDSEGRSEAAKMADFFRKKLAMDNLEVEAKSLASATMPAFLMIKEEERRMRDSLVHHNREMAKQAHAFMKPTLVINTNNKLIQEISRVDRSDPELAQEMAHALFDLARLSQREMEPEAMGLFITRNTKILEKLAERYQE